MVSKRKYLRKKKTLRTGPCSPFSKTITAWAEKRTLATRESRDYSGTQCRDSRAPRQKRQAYSATLAHTPEDTMLKVPCTGKENRMTYSTDGIILGLRLPP